MENLIDNLTVTIKTLIDTGNTDEEYIRSCIEAQFCISLGIQPDAIYKERLKKRIKPSHSRQRAEDMSGGVEHEFKNFHKNLCKRFGYPHDEVDWKRDQVSLEEHIAKQHESLKKKYDELIFSVGNKYPDETRHETALRYIRKAEELLDGGETKTNDK